MIKPEDCHGSGSINLQTTLEVCLDEVLDCYWVNTWDRLELLFEMGNICSHIRLLYTTLEYAPNVVVDEVLKKYRNNGWDIHIFSGRMEIQVIQGQ